MEFNANLVGISFNIAVTNIVLCTFEKCELNQQSFNIFNHEFTSRNSTNKLNPVKTASSAVEAFKIG